MSLTSDLAQLSNLGTFFVVIAKSKHLPCPVGGVPLNPIPGPSKSVAVELRLERHVLVLGRLW